MVGLCKKKYLLFIKWSLCWSKFWPTWASYVKMKKFSLYLSLLWETCTCGKTSREDFGIYCSSGCGQEQSLCAFFWIFLLVVGGIYLARLTLSSTTHVFSSQNKVGFLTLFMDKAGFFSSCTVSYCNIFYYIHIWTFNLDV